MPIADPPADPAELALESVRFTGLDAGPRLLVLGAVHGNEPCGPLAIRRAIEDCRRGHLNLLRGEVTFVPVANARAWRLRTREGDRNLNRDLREKPLPRDFEDRIGNRLCALLRQHDVLLDLHSFRGEGVPFAFFGPEDNAGPLEPFRHAAAEAAFAARLGTAILIHGWLETYAKLIAIRDRLELPKLSLTEGFGTTEFMRFAGGYAATLECGSHEDPAAPETGYRAIVNTLAHLGLIDAARPASTATTVIEMNDVLVCEREGDRLEGAWKTADPVPAGAMIARRADGTAVTAHEDGFIIFPNAAAKPGEGICYLGRKSARRV